MLLPTSLVRNLNMVTQNTYSPTQKVCLLPCTPMLIIAFDRLLLIAFQQTPEILQHHVPLVTNEKTGKIQVPSQNKHLTQISPLLKSLFQSTLVLLPNLSSPPTTLLVLSQTEKLIPYITGFRKLIKQLVTAILDIWSRTVRTSDDGDDDERDKAEEQDSVKVAAFLWIRKVMSLGDPSLRELCLKVSSCLPSFLLRLQSHA